MAEIWTGTADVENGGVLVTVAAGDPLSSANCSSGSLVLIDGVAYFVDERLSSATFNLTRVYAGSTDTGVGMEMSPVSPETTSMVNLLTVVARTQSQLNIFDKNSQGLFFNCLGVTGAADPGPGNMAFNNADPTAITRVYFDYLDANDAHRSVAGVLGTIGQNTRLRIRSLASTAYVEVQVTAAMADQTGWFSGEVVYIDHDGVIGATEPVSVSWSRDGQSLAVDDAGSFAERAAHDAASGGFLYLSEDGDGADLTGGVLFVKNSATIADWGPGIPLRGPKGDRGWAPRLAIATDGLRRVLQLVGYVGGEGVEPTTGVGQYISSGGLDSDVANGVDIRGPVGASAYAVAVAEGFVGDEATWLASLNGADGSDGANGVDGTDPGILLNWDDGTTDADPGAGNIRADAVDLSAATQLFVSKTNRAGDDVSAYLLALASSTNPVKGNLTLTRSGGNAQATFDVSAVTDDTASVKVAVANHSGATGFIDADAISFQFNRAGNQGSADAVSVASSINGAPEVTVPAVGLKIAVTDPDNSDNLSWLTLETLAENITPPAGEVDSKSAAYTVLPEDVGKVLSVSAAAAARTITLLPAATAGNGFIIGVEKSDSSSNTVTIDGDGSETINGATTHVLNRQRQITWYKCDGTAWMIVGEVDRAEGTWTPTLSFGGAAVGLTYATQTGTYTRIGRMVFLQGRITLSAKGSSTGDAALGGFPFPVGTERPTIDFGFFSGLSSLTGNVHGQAAPGQTAASLYHSSSSGSTALTNSHCGNSTSLYFSLTYAI